MAERWGRMTPAAPVGYSRRPLAAKLGIKAGSRVLPLSAPSDYEAMISPLPEGIELVTRLSYRVDVVHLFATRRAMLARELKRLRSALHAGGREGLCPDRGVVWAAAGDPEGAPLNAT